MGILSTLVIVWYVPSFYALLNSSKILCGISQNAPIMFTLLLTVEDLGRAVERDPTTDDIFLVFTFFGRVDWQTRMHSSRMRTVRSSGRISGGGGRGSVCSLGGLLP